MKPVQLGNILGDEDLDRDAIHIAVLKAEAAETLYPGEHVRLSAGEQARGCKEERSIGIVDPFLRSDIKAGQEFYILLKPYTITGLCHIWTHPEVPNLEVQMVGGSGARADGSNLGLTPEQAEAELFLREFSEEVDLTYSTLMGILQNANDDQDFYHTFNGTDTPEECYKNRHKLWDSWSIISGNKVRDSENVPFTCAC